jgi:hypothetical protein
VNENVEPWPGPSLSPTSTAHELGEALADGKAQPVPPYLRVVDESACENDWKSRPIASCDRPMPVSRTANVSSRVVGERLARDRDDDFAASVNFTAFDSRLRITWRSRVTSPRSPRARRPRTGTRRRGASRRRAAR